MARALWKGAISFGLVNIPVEMYTAEDRKTFSFSMLDKRDLSPVGYKRYNKTTGKEVAWSDIVKGYEYEKDRYVVLSDEDFRRANVKATQTIDIRAFVPADEIRRILRDAVLPRARPGRPESVRAAARKLEPTRRVAVAEVVLRTTRISARDPERRRSCQHAALPGRLDATGIELPAGRLEGRRGDDKEVDLANRLVDDMTEQLEPGSSRTRITTISWRASRKRSSRDRPRRSRSPRETRKRAERRSSILPSSSSKASAKATRPEARQTRGGVAQKGGAARRSENDREARPRHRRGVNAPDVALADDRHGERSAISASRRSLADARGARRAGSFVVQKHAASHLHYDFRLELDGVLLSWAVPKGPSLDPADKRLAMQTEDHPVEYGGFEGVIPEGEYGGGTVMVWDRGTWSRRRSARGRGQGQARIHARRRQAARRLVLVRTRGGKYVEDGRPTWLLIKEKDAFAKAGGRAYRGGRARQRASGRSLERSRARAARLAFEPVGEGNVKGGAIAQCVPAPRS